MKCFRITLWAVLGYLIFVPLMAGVAQEKPIGPTPLPDLYRLSPQLNIGDEFTVAEEQKLDGTIVITTEEAKHTFPYFKSTYHEYTEKIMETGQSIKSKRTYSLSRDKSILPQEGIKNETTSLEGKTLMLETTNHQIKILENLTKENPTVLKKHLPYITSLIEFKGLLPKTMVREGATWTIDTPDLGRVIFKDDYDAEKCSVKGKGVFEKIVNYPEGAQGTPCARISLELSVSHEGTETVPSLETNLAGTCFCSLENGMILFLELGGNFTLKKDIQGDETIQVITSGDITIRKKIK